MMKLCQGSSLPKWHLICFFAVYAPNFGASMNCFSLTDICDNKMPTRLWTLNGARLIIVWLAARGYFRRYYAVYVLTYCPISLFGFKGASSFSLCNGFMESDSSARVEIPANFEDAPVEYLVQLIGELFFCLQLYPSSLISR
jgi:hypothetical protein